MIELGETVKVRYIRPGIIAGKRGQHIGRRHARLLAFRSIDVHPILGIVGGKRGIDLTDFGTAGQGFDKLVGLFLEGGGVASRLVLQVKLETVAHAVARNHRRRHGEYRGIGNVGGGGINLSYHVVHRLSFALALAPIAEGHEIHGLRRAGTVEREACHRSAVFDLADAVKTAVELLHHLVCLRHGGAGLRVHAHHYRAGVLLRDKPCLCDIDQQDQQTE